jgi:hypothetical protein
VRRVGKMVLNRNPDNFFAETEQVAFCVSHVVPGIDFSNDPLLQGRIFSYLDTQLSRLGGPNFHQIPINRPVCPFQQRPARRHAPPEFLKDQYRHCKPMLVLGEGVDLLQNAGIPQTLPSGEADPGLLIYPNGALKDTLTKFALAIAKHRHFERAMDPPASVDRMDAQSGGCLASALSASPCQCCEAKKELNTPTHHVSIGRFAAAQY